MLVSPDGLTVDVATHAHVREHPGAMLAFTVGGQIVN
jgi:hypothetical protein